MRIRGFVAMVVFSCWSFLPVGQAAGFSLARVKVARTPVGDVVVSYDPRVANLINKAIVDPESEIKTVQILRTRLGNAPDWYRVDYNEGASVDPMFVVYSLGTGEPREVMREFGLALTLPGDGFIYISGHTNNYFDTFRKFSVTPTSSAEVEQPFYFVGISTTTLEPVDLFASTELARILASIPAGVEVLVVLNHGDLYLVRAPSGLVGWVKLKYLGTATQFKDINYAGD